MLLQNLTMASSGLYQCTAGNEAGKESCVVRVTVQCEYLRVEDKTQHRGRESQPSTTELTPQLSKGILFVVCFIENSYSYIAV